MTGGRCLCGAVTWEYEGDPNWIAHCHCESCRRNCAAPIVTFVGVPEAAFRWTGAAPAAFSSSPGVRRLFCGLCGTPVAYDAEAFDGEIHLYACGHDDPAALSPTAHVHHAEALAWLPIGDGLRRYPKGGAA